MSASSRAAASSRIGDADQLAHLDRQLDHRPRVRTTLEPVGVEQGVRCQATEHEIELPRQVGGVADAGAQSLTGEGRRLVGGVAGEEHPTAAPLLDPSGLEPVDGVLLEAGVVRAGVEWLEQAPRRGLLVQLIHGLAGQGHELPPAPAGAARHDRGRSGRIADLHVERIEHPGLVEHDVDDEPVVEEGAVVHRDPASTTARCCWRRHSPRRSAPARTPSRCSGRPCRRRRRAR